MKRLLELLIAFVGGVILLELYYYSNLQENKFNTVELATIFLTAGVLYLLIAGYIKQKKK